MELHSLPRLQKNHTGKIWFVCQGRPTSWSILLDSSHNLAGLAMSVTTARAPNKDLMERQLPCSSTHGSSWIYTAAWLLQAGGSVIALPASEPLEQVSAIHIYIYIYIYKIDIYVCVPACLAAWWPLCACVSYTSSPSSSSPSTVRTAIKALSLPSSWTPLWSTKYSCHPQRHDALMSSTLSRRPHVRPGCAICCRSFCSSAACCALGSYWRSWLHYWRVPGCRRLLRGLVGPSRCGDPFKMLAPKPEVALRTVWKWSARCGVPTCAYRQAPGGSGMERGGVGIRVQAQARV